MPAFTAQSEWSPGTALDTDETWVNTSSDYVSMTREALSGAADGGSPIPPGGFMEFSSGDTVYVRTLGGDDASIWREAM
jgi:hypothetical protein